MKVLRRSVRWVFFVTLVICLTLAWMIGRPQTLQWVVQQANQHFQEQGQRFSVTEVSGSLLRTIEVGQVIYENAYTRVTARGVNLHWSPWAFLWGTVDFSQLTLKTLEVRSLAPNPEPTILPKTLALPVRLALDKVQLGRLDIIDSTNALHFEQIETSFSAGPWRWHIYNFSGKTPWGVVTGGNLKIDTGAPFELSGQTCFAINDAFVDLKNVPVLDVTLTGDLGKFTAQTVARLNGASFRIEAGVAPFSPSVLRVLQASVKGLDPKLWGLPRFSAKINAYINTLYDANLGFTGSFALSNQSPGLSDIGKIPLQKISAQISGNLANQILNISDGQINLGQAGQLSLSGQLTHEQIDLKARIRALDLGALHGKLINSTIFGEVDLTGQPQELNLQARLHDTRVLGQGLRLDLDALIGQQHFILRKMLLESGGSQLKAQGKFALKGTQDFSAQLNLVDFNPAQFGGWPEANLNLHTTLQGALKNSWQIVLQAQMSQSSLLKQPLSVQASMTLNAQHVIVDNFNARWAKMVLRANGSYGETGDKLDLKLDAADLKALSALLGSPVEGALTAQTSISGRWDDPSFSVYIKGEDLGFAQDHLGKMTLSISVPAGIKDAVNGQAVLHDLQIGAARFGLAQAELSGTLAAHILQASIRGLPQFSYGNKSVSEVLDLNIRAQGAWLGWGWQGTFTQLHNLGAVPFLLEKPAQIQVASKHFRLSDVVLDFGKSGRLTVPELRVAQGEVNSRGVLIGIRLQDVLRLIPNMTTKLDGVLETDLRLGGKWDLNLGKTFNGYAEIHRESGDVRILSDFSADLGLSTLNASAKLERNVLSLALSGDGKNLGTIEFLGHTILRQENGKWSLPMSVPVSANARARMENIVWLGSFATQLGLDLAGQLSLDLELAGTLDKPQLKGKLDGEKLRIDWPDQGLMLKDGMLRAVLVGHQLRLQQLHFTGGGGSVTVSGQGGIKGGLPELALEIDAKKLQLLSRPDRVLVLSGNGHLGLAQNGLDMNGKFDVDHALIELSHENAPVMSQDVVIKGRAVHSQSKIWPLKLNLGINFGQHFKLRGLGLDALLGGSLDIRALPGTPLRAFGVVNVHDGSYAAYGQNLSITRGMIGFSGPLSNPSLDIYAQRKKTGDLFQSHDIEVGIQIRGTAQVPNAKLVSNTPMPDSEKLSWIFFGHGGDVGAKEQESAAIGVAASAIFGSIPFVKGQRDGLLGLDEVGVSKHAQGLETTVVTVGKRLSERAYLKFEHNATNADSLVKLTYALTRNLSLQAKTSSSNSNALDLFYSWIFD